MTVRTVKMADMGWSIACQVFRMLNPGKVEYRQHGVGLDRKRLVTDVDPKKLIYPEGWYYAKGRFTNKHNTSTGVYDEVYLLDSKGRFWEDLT